MSAIKKEDLERLEAEYGFEPDDLSYQHRCSRITAAMKGEDWVPPEKPEQKVMEDRPTKIGPHGETISKIQRHPLYGKRILITPMMTPNGNRFITYDEPLGPEIETADFNAGKRIYDQGEDVQRMVGDYDIINVDQTKQVIAKSSIPKVNTEISWCLGKELVPVVRGNDGHRGYIWSLPSQVVQIGDTLIQLYGLKTLITSTYPELLPQFDNRNNRSIMEYIDGVTLAASIPMTEALLKEHTRKELIDERAGIRY